MIANAIAEVGTATLALGPYGERGCGAHQGNECPNQVERVGSQLRAHSDELLRPSKQTAQEAAQDLQEGMRGPATDAVESVKSTARDAADATKQQARDSGQEAATGLREAGQDAAREARDRAGS
ncbi:hypothetical protein ABZ454_38905 [Streptomyces sp. NPDC005803]|uniref:hypothetical protein n=1 Tax=Streptomyces sp. NPDC005803 TaxID=3154297 RepID=UPI0033EE0AEC